MHAFVQTSVVVIKSGRFAKQKRCHRITPAQPVATDRTLATAVDTPLSSCFSHPAREQYRVTMDSVRPKHLY